MNDIQAQNERLRAREKSMEGEVTNMRAKLIADLTEKTAELTKDLSGKQKIIEELSAITKPFDKKIEDTQKHLFDMNESEAVNMFEKEAFDILNSFIIENNLEIQKLESSIGILDFKKDESYSPDGPKPPTSPFIFDLESKRHRSLSSWWNYNFKTMNGLPLSWQNHGDALKPALNAVIQIVKKAESVKRECSKIRSRIREIQDERENAVIPWNNRHDLTEDKFVENYDRLSRELENKMKRLNSIKNKSAEGEQILQELIANIEGEISKAKQQLDEYEKELIDKITGILSDEIHSKYHANFMLRLIANSKLSIRTGSKGDFIIPPGMDYIYAERLWETGEKVFWFVEIEPKFGNFRLSNSNAVILSEGSDDRTWMYDIPL